MSRPIGAARMGLLPPYLFAAIEQKIADKRAAGVDIISLGIGDPDTPTPPLIVERMRSAVLEPGTHQYPSNRGRQSFRDAVAGFYGRRFGVDLDPATEIIPALGAKEAIANLNLALLDPGDVALASDPGYPVYTNGPLLVGAEPVAMPLVPELGFQPDLAAMGGLSECLRCGHLADAFGVEVSPHFLPGLFAHHVHQLPEHSHRRSDRG